MDFLDLISGWDSMKTWQKVIGVLFVALVLLDLGFELGRNVGVVHPQGNVVQVELSGNIISNTTHFVDDETFNGTAKTETLTLAHIPNPTNSLLLFRNGQRLRMGPENDYTLSGNKITLLFDSSWDQFDASYRY
jgi:hypothetical protein